MNRQLTEQEKNPHLSLVSVRNCIETCLDVPRSEAAVIANSLSHEQCDDVVAADGDAKRVEAAIQTAKAVTEEKPVAPKKPATKSAKSTSLKK